MNLDYNNETEWFIIKCIKEYKDVHKHAVLQFTSVSETVTARNWGQAPY